MTPDEIVTAFVKANSGRDIDAICDFLAPDVVYENIGMSTATGIDEVRASIEGFHQMASKMEWEVLRQVADDRQVLNERIDRFWLGDDRQVDIRVAGVFEVRDGKITAWRDYFDTAGVQTQFAGR